MPVRCRAWSAPVFASSYGLSAGLGTANSTIHLLLFTPRLHSIIVCKACRSALARLQKLGEEEIVPSSTCRLQRAAENGDADLFQSPTAEF